MYCGWCGTENNRNAKFCAKCGRILYENGGQKENDCVNSNQSGTIPKINGTQKCSIGVGSANVSEKKKKHKKIVLLSLLFLFVVFAAFFGIQAYRVNVAFNEYETILEVISMIERKYCIESEEYVSLNDANKENNGLEKGSFERYIKAVEETTAIGSWREELTATANMSLVSSSQKLKTKATIEVISNVQGYAVDNYDNLKITGTVNMNVLDLEYAYDIEYENGKAEYNFTKPKSYSTEIEIKPSFFDMYGLTEDMVCDFKVSTNTMEFTIPGDIMSEKGSSLMGSLSASQQIKDLTYGDVKVKVLTSDTTGKIDSILMSFQASMNYQGYDAEAEYEVRYKFNES